MGIAGGAEAVETRVMTSVHSFPSAKGTATSSARLQLIAPLAYVPTVR
jgi:hypothetical protein